MRFSAYEYAQKQLKEIQLLHFATGASPFQVIRKREFERTSREKMHCIGEYFLEQLFQALPQAKIMLLNANWSNKNFSSCSTSQSKTT